MSGAGAAGASRSLPQGLTLTSTMRSRLKTREVSTRKQVGDTESMVNEEPTRSGSAYSHRSRGGKDVGWDDEEVV